MSNVGFLSTQSARVASDAAVAAVLNAAASSSSLHQQRPTWCRNCLMNGVGHHPQHQHHLLHNYSHSDPHRHHPHHHLHSNEDERLFAGGGVFIMNSSLVAELLRFVESRVYPEFVRQSQMVICTFEDDDDEDENEDEEEAESDGEEGEGDGEEEEEEEEENEEEGAGEQHQQQLNNAEEPEQEEESDGEAMEVEVETGEKRKEKEEDREDKRMKKEERKRQRKAEQLARLKKKHRAEDWLREREIWLARLASQDLSMEGEQSLAIEFEEALYESGLMNVGWNESPLGEGKNATQRESWISDVLMAPNTLYLIYHLQKLIPNLQKAKRPLKEVEDRYMQIVAQRQESALNRFYRNHVQELAHALVNWETALGWDTVEEEIWRGRREAWIKEVLSGPPAVRVLLEKLLEFEKVLLPETVTEKWKKEVRSEWLAHITTLLQSPHQPNQQAFARCLMQLEKETLSGGYSSKFGRRTFRTSLEAIANMEAADPLFHICVWKMFDVIQAHDDEQGENIRSLVASLPQDLVITLAALLLDNGDQKGYDLIFALEERRSCRRNGQNVHQQKQMKGEAMETETGE
ncbi:ISWI chromatin-remodeling complex ATPase CHR11 [Balamuthia mandrillaris]